MEKEKKNKTYTMRITEELFRKIEIEANKRKRSVNFIVNEKLEKAYRKKEVD